MESTGIYWKPVFYVLEEAATCVLANAAQIAQVPGRKTDMKNCVGIAQLLEHGLIRKSFVPPAPIRELRDLTRYRKALIQERTREANRLHTDPAVLADRARGRLRTKLPALRQALVGRFRGHHAFLGAQILAHLDYLDEVLETVSTQIGTVIAPFADELARLETIPGVNTRTAEVLIAELGVDMRVFPTAGHLASWAGLCPGNNESAGTHRSGRTLKGNPWLRGALIEPALSAGTHSATGALAARFRRVMQHRGHTKAVVAVAHAILTTAYHLLARQTTFENPGADYDDRRHAERVRRRAIHTLERQGFRVSLEPAA